MNTENLYDEVNYKTEPNKWTHPFKLSNLARLYGINSKDPSEANIIEIGCGTGSNIIPLALFYPNSSFIGVDSSLSQINEGRILTQKLGIKNITLLHKDFTSLDFKENCFDYIIAHGVLSWITKDLQNKLFSFYSRYLTSTGIGYLSYNAFPGWYFRGFIREAMFSSFNSDDDKLLKIKKSRNFLTLLHKNIYHQDGINTLLIKEEIANIINLPDWYLFHDLIEEDNNPLSFKEFTEKLNQNKLNYVCDSNLIHDFSLEFNAEVQSFLEIINNRVQREIAKDFLKLQMFRKSIISKHEVSQFIDLEKIKEFKICFKLNYTENDTNNYTYFKSNSSAKVTSILLEVKLMVDTMNSIYPEFVSISELLKKVEDQMIILKGGTQNFNGYLDPEHSKTKIIEINLLKFILKCFICNLTEYSHKDFFLDFTSTNTNQNFQPCPYVLHCLENNLPLINRFYDSIELTSQEKEFLSFLNKEKELNKSSLLSFWNDHKMVFQDDFTILLNKVVKKSILVDMK